MTYVLFSFYSTKHIREGRMPPFMPLRIAGEPVRLMSIFHSLFVKCITPGVSKLTPGEYRQLTLSTTIQPDLYRNQVGNQTPIYALTVALRIRAFRVPCHRSLQFHQEHWGRRYQGPRYNSGLSSP